MSELIRKSSRDQWGHKMEFVLSCVGYSVGLGNVWRFPYLAYKNGGAAFVLAYLILQILIGKPMYFMELALGQYSGKGPVRMWDMLPAVRGVGMAMCIISFLITVYYNVLMAYILHYFFASFQETLPWSHCKPEWKHCITDRIVLANMTICEENSKPGSNCMCSGDETVDLKLGFTCYPKLRPPAEIYFYDEVIKLGRSLSSGDVGTPLWHLALSLLAAWVIVLACVIKGVKSTGKVVYFTATFPYVVLLILLVRGATLPGAIKGVEFFIVPKWKELARLQLWLDALGQMFFSLGLSMGGIISASSYSAFNNNIYNDSLIISSMDLITSMIAGFVIFTTFGHISETSGVNIAKVASTSYGLAFVAYPEALATLPAPQLWSSMFFLMLLTLGLDSEFALFETFLTYLEDDFRACRRHKIKLRLVIGLACFLLGLAFVCPGGMYLMTIFDTYGAAYALIAVSAMEVVSVSWIYGLGRFLSDMEYMLGKKPSFLPFWYISLAVVSPIVMCTMSVLTLVKSETPKYKTGLEFGSNIMIACWAVYVLVIIPIPAWLLLHLAACYRKHGFQGCSHFLSKVTESSPRWGPADGTNEAAIKRLGSVWADVCPLLEDNRPPTPPPVVTENVFLTGKILEREVIVTVEPERVETAATEAAGPKPEEKPEETEEGEAAS